MRLATSLGVLACVVFASACVQLGPSQHRPVAVKSHDPGQVECPGGKAVRPGLKNFGAYIGTWEANHHRDTQFSTAYAIGMIPGRVVVDCSSDDFVVVEAIYPRYQAPAGEALRVALTDLPDDSTKVYEHTHTGCRTFQFQSKKLAQQLGADDNDGRVTIAFESQTATYNPSSIYLILIDLHDRLGQDTRDC